MPSASKNCRDTVATSARSGVTPTPTVVVLEAYRAIDAKMAYRRLQEHVGAFHDYLRDNADTPRMMTLDNHHFINDDDWGGGGG